MAIFRCNKCAHLEEQPGGWIGETVPCPKCGNPAQVYNSVFFVGKLLDKYFDAQREIARLKAQIADTAKSASPAPIAPPPLDEIDLSNTDQLASDLQHQPIHDWFTRKQVRVQFNTNGVDTTGFFEWHALMTCLQYAKQRKSSFSCARNLNITLQHGESFELDVFLLIDGKQPIYVECKTGEFRQDIDKYLKLRKFLGISGNNFIMCITGLTDDHAKGLTAMYGLTFTNEVNLATELVRLF